MEKNTNDFTDYISSPEGLKRISEIKEEMKSGYRSEVDEGLFESAAFYRALTEHGRSQVTSGKIKNPEKFWETLNQFEKKEQYYLDTIRETMPKNQNKDFCLEDFIKGLEDA